MNRLVLIEFNELCPALLDRWMAAGKLPNFSRFWEASDVFVTEADETEPVNLEPWIQWYSLHTGLPFQEHKVFHLTDGAKASHSDIWSMLAAQGRQVWNCGSMNARAPGLPNAAFLPDPWCTGQKSNPPELDRFYQFVSQQVREYSNPGLSNKLVQSAQFIAFMLSHGLSFGTVTAIVRQVVEDQRTGGKTSWKRAPLLDRLQFDVFRHYYSRLAPDFSTFFVNSTAHLQHAYWRCMEPEKFTVKPPPAELERHQDSILFGYQEMDRLLGRFMALAGEDTCLVFATALSQQPYLKYEAIGGHNFYRPLDLEGLLRRLGIVPANVRPVMTHQFMVHFATEAEAARASETLGALRLDGQPAFEIRPPEGNALYLGNQIRTRVPADAVLTLPGGGTAPYFEIFYRIDEIKSGRHHPDGCLWIRRGRHALHRDKVSILSLCPTILTFFGIAPPPQMAPSLWAEEQWRRPERERLPSRTPEPAYS